MDDRPTYVSLFAGIGGLDLAAEAFGYTCTGQVEWDRHCTAVLERGWPGVPRWGDIATYPGSAGLEGPQSGIARDAEPARAYAPPDFIVGGFPCQPASTAGRRKGTADDRWLWPEFARVIGELGPRRVLVENVPGLTTVNGGRAFSEVMGTLADLGYDTTWTSVRASDVGAPHRRERIFILAHAQRDGLARPRLSLEREALPAGASEDAAHPHHGGHGPELRPPSLTGLHQGEAGAEPQRPGFRAVAVADDERWERSREARGRGTGPSDFSWGAYEPAIRRWETVMGCAPHPVDDKGRLAPPFVEWMQGFRAGWTAEMTRTQALKALGNAVVPQQAIAAMTLLDQLERTHA